MADPRMLELLSLVNIEIPGYNEEETEGIMKEPNLEPGVYINELGQKILIRTIEPPINSKLKKVE